MEMEVKERKDEVTYYDSLDAHSCCYKLWCCPHSGKITSERVIYSDQTPFPSWEPAGAGSCSWVPSWKYIQSVLLWPCSKRLESVDIDAVTDISVRQGCFGSFSNCGGSYLREARAAVLFC